MRSSITACPVGCGRTKRPGDCMCCVCWAEVPARMRRQAYRTWRVWQRYLDDVDAMLSYRSALDEAIGSVLVTQRAEMRGEERKAVAAVREQRLGRPRASRATRVEGLRDC